jgi:hypothetical protein
MLLGVQSPMFTCITSSSTVTGAPTARMLRNWLAASHRGLEADTPHMRAAQVLLPNNIAAWQQVQGAQHMAGSHGRASVGHQLSGLQVMPACWQQCDATVSCKCKL